MSDVSHIAPPFMATPRQQELAAAWRDPAAKIVTAGRAIRSGKTQGAGRLFFETAITHPSTYLVSRLTYRELEDSTKKAMLRGDGDLPPMIPPEAIREERAGDNLVHLDKMRHERQREAALEPGTRAVSAVRSARLSSGHRPVGPIAVGVAIGISEPLFTSTHGYASMWPIIGLPVLLAALLLKRLARSGVTA